MSAPWIAHPLSLAGQRVELCPVEEVHLDELFELGRDREIWRLTSVDYSDPQIFYPSFAAALRERELGKTYPFLIRLRGDGRIVGTTRFLEIQPQDRKLEIGVTWMASAFWGSGINLECKLLLLAHCFETLDANRVQFRAKADNARSRRALEKIGAVFEGVMRKDKIEASGKPRDTAFYSIVSEEWPALKPRLAAQLEAAG
ncbi:RimJ/RimL family protein N-acetyltransferase [Dyella sp. SG562]|uniref:GNAT family N-acetyltransferase n=1 Tax=Dyella sp. SG562 TaxID=2587017 RepID=UPI001421D475|nr:GNAT family protein [Dyella sp. SG562]NII72864.1 RimJ/RimL family protein N-acetyltransferase [Dyella sp. SG562]